MQTRDILPSKTMKNTTKTVTIRLPDDLYRAIALLADTEHRSLNQQIVYLLQKQDRAPEGKEKGGREHETVFSD